VSFYQRSLALFFGELAGPTVTVVDAKDTVAGEAIKGLRVTVQELGYVSLWYVKNRYWQVVRPGGAPQRSAVPSSAVIYQVGTEVVGDLLRISQDAYLQPGGDRPLIESYVRTFEGFLQQNIPQGLASLKAYDGVERARTLLEELRREYQARLAAGPEAAINDTPPLGEPVLLPVEAFLLPEPEPTIVYDLDAAEDVDLTYDAESIAWPPPPDIAPEAGPAVPPPISAFEAATAAAFEPAPAPAFEAAAAAFVPLPVVEEPAPTPMPAPAAEPVTVVPQTTASYVFDQALVGLLGRLGTIYPWLLPDYGRHGDGMGVRVTLPAGFSVVFTHVGSDWTAYSQPESAPATHAHLEGDDAVVGWAVPRIRDYTAAYGARLGAERPGDAAQLFQRVADLS
jgi:hypothetical protein